MLFLAQLECSRSRLRASRSTPRRSISGYHCLVREVHFASVIRSLLSSQRVVMLLCSAIFVTTFTHLIEGTTSPSLLIFVDGALCISVICVMSRCYPRKSILTAAACLWPRCLRAVVVMLATSALLLFIAQNGQQVELTKVAGQSPSSHCGPRVLIVPHGAVQSTRLRAPSGCCCLVALCTACRLCSRR